jgi:hypothetical protein
LIVNSSSLSSGSGIAIAPESSPGLGLTGAGTNASGSTLGKSPGGASTFRAVAACLRFSIRFRLSRPFPISNDLFLHEGPGKVALLDFLPKMPDDGMGGQPVPRGPIVAYAVSGQNGIAGDYRPRSRTWTKMAVNYPGLERTGWTGTSP